jgi:suppressor of G2 allele of SKP1
MNPDHYPQNNAKSWNPRLEILKEARKKAMLAAEEKGKYNENAKPSEPSEPVKPTGPSYPTSSKSGAKNWDAIADEEDDGKDDSDINLFFKKLYKGSTPDQQRAMMNSFTESNGTSLSTSWESVKDGKVETVPPAGVEAKPYNQ